jgi:hypothetical protein
MRRNLDQNFWKTDQLSTKADQELRKAGQKRRDPTSFWQKKVGKSEEQISLPVSAF